MVNAEVLTTAVALGGGAVTYLTPGEVSAADATLSAPLSQDRAWQDWAAQAGFAGL